MNNNFSDKSNNFLTSSSVNEGFAKESLRAPKVLKVEDLRSSDRRDSRLGSEGTPTKPPNLSGGCKPSFVDFTELRSSARTTSMNDLGFSMPLRSASFACNLEPPMVVLKVLRAHLVP